MTESNDKPTPTEIWECCGGGCSPCVWDRYYDELELWNEKNGIDAKTSSTPAVDRSDDHLFR